MMHILYEAKLALELPGNTEKDSMGAQIKFVVPAASFGTDKRVPVSPMAVHTALWDAVEHVRQTQPGFPKDAQVIIAELKSLGVVYVGDKS